jgi:cellulose synthase/poly-beta-1,6-N-acetylglucosamine synthase-like glycosyltransferase
MAMRKRSYWFEMLLGIGSVLAILYYVRWWATDERLQSPLLLLVLGAALVYIVCQMVGSWVLNLAARFAPPPPAPSPKLTVDVFVTAYREPLEMVRHALAAAMAMRGEKQVWLLDDGQDPALAELAQQLGCGYLTRTDRRHAKAGNMNAALPRTNGEIIAIFDIDHAPRPDFLERSLGYFDDPQVGFVQVMLTFRNFTESWVARAATESSLEFYNPTYLGADRLGAATLMGSNALIRRTALESIGGYQPGLAEDLATSLALHAAGWRSAYVGEPLAPGLSPSSLAAWSVQQLKWARGVFELLLTGLPRAFGKLTGGQRISYLVRMTKYWIGPAIFVHLLATIAVLFWGDAPTRMAFHQYLQHLAPLVLIDAAIRSYALSRFRHPEVPASSLLGAVVLVYASWPIYLLAWTLAILRLPVRFRPTPKERDAGLNILWLMPQLLALALLLLGGLYTIFVQHHPVSLVLAFATAQALLQFMLLARWVQEDWNRGGLLRRRLAPGRAGLYANRNP